MSGNEREIAAYCRQINKMSQWTGSTWLLFINEIAGPCLG
jgi:hypothetical protein